MSISAWLTGTGVAAGALAIFLLAAPSARQVEASDPEVAPSVEAVMTEWQDARSL